MRVNVLDDFFALLESTEVMKQVIMSLKEEPARLLGSICREYGRTGLPVADHCLSLVGYLGEASLKALVSSGLVLREDGSTMALYRYRPTAEGMRYYESLKAGGFYRNK
jgi:hypothetical protein